MDQSERYRTGATSNVIRFCSLLQGSMYCNLTFCLIFSRVPGKSMRRSTCPARNAWPQKRESSTSSEAQFRVGINITPWGIQANARQRTRRASNAVPVFILYIAIYFSSKCLAISWIGLTGLVKAAMLNSRTFAIFHHLLSLHWVQIRAIKIPPFFCYFLGVAT